MAADQVDDDIMEENYRIPWLAVQLHSLPRLDMAFHRVRSTFRLDSQHYKEVSAGVPL